VTLVCVDIKEGRVCEVIYYNCFKLKFIQIISLVQLLHIYFKIQSFITVLFLENVLNS